MAQHDYREYAAIFAIVGAFLLGYFTTRLLERLPVSSYRRVPCSAPGCAAG